MRANPDGTELEVLAWGLHNPTGVAFSPEGRLWVTNRGMSEKGSRPIANAPDEFHEIVFGSWYGWPDFAGGEPVSRARFAPEVGAAPRLLMASHPVPSPPQPFAAFASKAGPGRFDFSPGGEFGFKGQAFIALKGSGASKVVRLDLQTGRVHDFVRNGPGKPGTGSPADVLVNLRAARFGPDGDLYLVDAGPVRRGADDSEPVPGGGTIWRIRLAETEPGVEDLFPEVPGLGLDKIALGLVIGVAIGALLARAPLKRRRRRI
jgi:glucose/arabinose dehydrogenase